MKLRKFCVALLVVAVLVSFTAAAKKPAANVLFDRNGNALVAYGGSKDRIPTFAASTSAPATLTFSTESISSGSFTLRKWKSTSFGDGSVRTEFVSTVDWGVEFWIVWREVEGQSMTYWVGGLPQEYSDKIELDEYWKFGGVSVSVSYPSGVGASGSSNTIRWDGDDGGTGTHWYLAHIYSGYYAQSYIAMTYVKQSSDGSHRFDAVWVSACAVDQDTP